MTSIFFSTHTLPHLLLQSPQLTTVFSIFLSFLAQDFSSKLAGYHSDSVHASNFTCCTFELYLCDMEKTQSLHLLHSCCQAVGVSWKLTVGSISEGPALSALRAHWLWFFFTFDLADEMRYFFFFQKALLAYRPDTVDSGQNITEHHIWARQSIIPTVWQV